MLEHNLLLQFNVDQCIWKSCTSPLSRQMYLDLLNCMTLMMRRLCRFVVRSQNRSNDSNFRTVGFKMDGWDGSWIKLVGRSIFGFAAAATTVIAISCDSLGLAESLIIAFLLLVESLIGLVNRIERAYMVLSDYGGDSSLNFAKSSILESIISCTRQTKDRWNMLSFFTRQRRDFQV